MTKGLAYPETKLKFEEQVSYLGRSVENASNDARGMNGTQRAVRSRRGAQNRHARVIGG